MNKNITLKVGMLIIMESDLEAAVEFYKKIGLELKFHLKEKWAEFAIGSTKVGLCPTTHPPFDRHTGIVLEVNSLEKFRFELESHGISFLNEPLEAVHGIMASIKDPSGNVIDVYEPTPEKVKEFAQRIVQE